MGKLRPLLSLVPAVFFSLAHVSAGHAAVTYYVAPNGDDSNPGTITAPFRTIGRAQAVVRGMNANMTSDIVVALRGGRYELPNTLMFTPQDSGSNGYTVTYASYPGETARISGGRVVTGWTAFGNGIYRANVGSLNFRQLHVNGSPAIRAREPNAGNFNAIAGFINPTKQIQVNASEIQNYVRSEGVEFIFHQEWIQYIARIESVATVGPLATVTLRAENPRRNIFDVSDFVFGGWQTQYYYHIENALEALDSPGEWYLNRQSGDLFYMPRPGEDMTNALVTAPAMERIVDISGTLSNPVHDLLFIGLTFEDSTWLLPSSEEFANLQADQLINRDEIIGAAVFVQNATNLLFQRNVFHDLGGSGLMLYSGDSNINIVGNVFKDISASGVVVDGTHDKQPEDTRTVSRNNFIRNNYFTRTARDYRGSLGVFATFPEGLVVEHNEFTDLPYSAINVGWGWTLDDTPLKNNVIRYNKIHNVSNFLSDGGGIYTLSKQPGTIVRENYVYDIRRSRWAGRLHVAGIYLDVGSSYMRVENNVIEDTEWVYQLGTGYNNTLINVLNTAPTYLLSSGSAEDTVINDGNLMDAAAIKANAGIEPAFQDIISEQPVVTGPPRLSVSSTAVSAGTPIQIVVENAPGVGCDWVGLYHAGTNSLVWAVYLSGTPTCNAPQRSASFPWVISLPDVYDFRLFDAGDTAGTSPLSTSSVVTVTQ